MPVGSSRCLREDIVNPDLLYLGTEFAAWASINRGQSWFKINGDKLPTVAIHEFAQATTAPEIVAATHGRSLWVLDVTTLRQVKTDAAKDKTLLFTPATVTRWQLDTTHEGMFRTGTRVFLGENPPRGAVFDFVLGKKAEKLEMKIVDIQGKTVRTLDVTKETEPGIHRVTWDLSSEPQGGKGKGKAALKGKGMSQGSAIAGKGPQPGGPPAKPGIYRVMLVADGQEQSQTLVIEPDPHQRGGEIITDEVEEELARRRLLKEAKPVFDP